MNEAQKAQLRYIQIMRSSTEWQTDMGRTLIQPANALRVVKEQFTLLAQAIVDNATADIPSKKAAVKPIYFFCIKIPYQ